MTREILASLIPEHLFNEYWKGVPAPYEQFLQTAAERLTAKITMPVTKVTGSMESTGENRARIDGSLTTLEGNKTYYAEMVWLPSSQSYRGTANVWDTPSEPEPKSVVEFIAAINAIVDDTETIFEGQVFNAREGLDEESENLPKAYPAIFSLFERFPSEDFGNPGALIHLMEARGGYEDLLFASVSRIPSIPAVTMINRLLNSAIPPQDRTKWIRLLEEVATSGTTDADTRELANELVNRRWTRDTEQNAGAEPPGLL